MGFNAGVNLTTGSNNIDIGNAVWRATQTRSASASGTQTATFIAGIFGNDGSRRSRSDR